MKDLISQRAVDLGEYIANTGATIRYTAKQFGLSKSTVHKDVSERLQRINRALYKRVSEVLKFNMQQRHIRGGIATRNKYKQKNNNYC